MTEQKKTLLKCPLFLTLLLLVSCVDIETEFVLLRDGRVDINLEYIFDASSAQIGRGFGSDEPWIFPLTETEFRLQTLRHEGIELRRYRMHPLPDGRERVRVTMRAESIEACGDLFGWEIVKTQDDANEIINIKWNLEDTEMDAWMEKSIRKLVGSSVCVIRVRTPQKIQSVSLGEIDGRNAIFKSSLEEWIFDPLADDWTISW